MSELIIYGHWVSQPSRAVMWALKMKNVPFKFVEINPQTGDTQKPDFLAKFPTHTIPTMEYDGLYCSRSINFFLQLETKIAESNAILLFLAERFGWDDLYPRDAKIRAGIASPFFLDSFDHHKNDYSRN